ncbi:MAG: Hsp20 family protein [Albidovulum sp.]|nr:Hsp20 family protein [Albidovulum sp.]
MSKQFFGSHPFLLGFDQLDRLLEISEKSGSGGYPPYNIVRTSSDQFQISVAVAGFSSDDLDVTVEGRQLHIAGKRRESGARRVFLHNGIAARQFRRSFVLAEGMEVSGARLADGLLHIELFRKSPDPQIHRIEIATL